MYSNKASYLLNHSSKIVGNMGYAMVPGQNPVIGGGALGVAKYTSHLDDALAFNRWMCSEPISSAAT